MTIYNGKRIVVDRKTETHNERFNAKTVNYVEHIKKQKDELSSAALPKSVNDGATASENTNVNHWMRESFQEILDFGIRNTEPHHYVGIKINVPDAENTKPIGLSYRPVNSLSSEILVDLMENVIQSNDVFDITERLEISMQIIEIPSGSGAGVRLNSLSEENILQHKKGSIFKTKANYNDSKCLPRSLILGKILADKVMGKKLKQYLRINSKTLKLKTNLLIKNAKVNVNTQIGCILNDVYKFQKIMKNYQILIYDSFTDPTSLLYKSPKMKKVINLFYLRRSEHFIVLKSVRAFFGFRYQCKFCEKMMQSIEKHNCKKICKYCRKTPACPITDTMHQCVQCNRVFRGEVCFQQHTKKDMNEKKIFTNTCSTYRICDKCFKFLELENSKSEHICSDKWCSICRNTVSADHMCYIQPYKKNPPKQWGLIFFDIEARQERVLSTHKKTGISEYLHEANLCIASQVSIHLITCVLRIAQLCL